MSLSRRERRWEAVRLGRGVYLSEQAEGGHWIDIPPGASLAVRNHSPDGYEFGYGGSGPSQLALAIALRYFHGDRERAEKHYFDIRDRFIAPAKGDTVMVTASQIAAILEPLDSKR